MTEKTNTKDKAEENASVSVEKTDTPEKTAKNKALPKEVGGTDGPEPTRYGDWEHKGIISDF